MKEDVPYLFFHTDTKLYYKDELPILPEWYRKYEFLNDILAMFMKNEKRLGKKNLEIILKRVKKKTEFSKEEWAAIQRFYIKFQKTKIFKELLEQFDAYDAARFLIALITAKQQQIVSSSSSATASSFIDAINLILRECQNGFPLPLPFGGGKEAGKGSYSVKYLRKSLEVQKILKELMIKWKSVSEVIEDKEATLEPAEDLEPEKIANYSEITKIFEYQLAYDELFEYKLATKQLLKKQYYRYKYKAKKFIVLIDVSGSMQNNDAYIYAIATAIAILKNAQKSKVNKVKIALFDEKIVDEIETDTDTAIQRLLEVPFSGGGTSINTALQYADEQKCDEIILITDGEDRVTYKPETKLYTIFLNGNNENLKKISNNYETIYTY